MPFYDYKCVECEHVMPNQLKKYSDKTITCEKCQKDTSQQQFSGKFAAHGLPNGHIGSRIRRG
jgi:putative FmdB family regulatory protein